ncbi:MAG: four helix bundle protein [Sulfurospirillaceae bacterium]|nr:four helix bundle protein [Sulfurospirillaceae bacterium]
MDYKDLLVWQESMDLAVKVYELAKKLPKEEIYVLSDQIRRAAVSIPSNIAEGQNRNTPKEFIQFLYIALGSASELETQLLLVQKLNYLSNISEELKQTLKIRKMINALIGSVRRKNGL